MNFLAHLQLSGNNNQIKIGNFIGDAIKGKNHQNYKPEIQKGILLHRKIDYYTDRHNITKKLNTFFAPKYGKYAGIVVDIIYDYYLANNWNKYSNIDLESFISNTYRLLVINFRILPLKIKSYLPILIAKNRLLSYRSITGIENVLTTMAKYTSLPDEAQFAMEVLKNNNKYFQEQFLLFYDDIMRFVKNELTINNNVTINAYP